MLHDAAGRTWEFIDKAPAFTAAPLDERTAYPQLGVVACEVVGRRIDELGRALCTINTEQPWGVAATGGETQFEVFAHQLTTTVA